MNRPAVAACLLILLAGCGGDDDEAGGGGRSAAPAADLTVTVRLEGRGGPVRERRIVCERLGPRAQEPVCRRITAEQLAPVPRTRPCTAIYGGPAVARIRGTIRGERVDARFGLQNGCEIARWKRNRSLLGAVP
jgi:hypothetical protein